MNMSQIHGWQRVLERAIIDLHDLANEIKQGKRIAHIPNHLRVDALDALCDREVTGNGVAFLAGMDKDGADKAVLDSNDSKLEDGKAVILPGARSARANTTDRRTLRPLCKRFTKSGFAPMHDPDS